jgi:hypothetical protein
LTKEGKIVAIPKAGESSEEAVKRVAAKHPGKEVVDPPAEEVKHLRPKMFIDEEMMDGMSDAESVLSGDRKRAIRREEIGLDSEYLKLITPVRGNIREFIAREKPCTFMNEHPDVGIENPSVVSRRVSKTGISMKSRIMWVPPESMDYTYGVTESVGEDWKFVGETGMTFGRVGHWDKRTMVMHSALVGLKPTDAGFDKAYLSALSSVHELFAGRRAEVNQTTRDYFKRYIGKSVHPFRLLVRGVSLWLSLCMRTAGNWLEKKSWRYAGMATQPYNAYTLIQYNAIVNEMSEESRDVVFLRLHGSSEAYMVNAAMAMCSSENPLENIGLRCDKVWPDMNKPMVFYCNEFTVRGYGNTINAIQVWNTLERICTQLDCFDLLDEAVKFVGFWASRPEDSCGWLGSEEYNCGLPESDMTACGIGPLTADVSSEGLRTEPIPMPSWKEVVYYGALRANFALAAQVEVLQDEIGFGYGIRGHHMWLRNRYAAFYDIGKSGEMMRRVNGVCQQAGWDRCIGVSLGHLGFRGVKGTTMKNVAEWDRYPGWLPIIKYTSEMAAGRQAEIIRPAVPSGIPMYNTWCRWETAGLQSTKQVMAIQYWMQMEIMCVRHKLNGDTDAGTVNVTSLNRCWHNIKPMTRFKDQRIISLVRFQGDKDFHDNLANVKMLNKCDVYVADMLPEEEGIPEAMLDESGIEWGMYDEFEGRSMQKVMMSRIKVMDEEGEIQEIEVQKGMLLTPQVERRKKRFEEYQQKKEEMAASEKIPYEEMRVSFEKKKELGWQPKDVEMEVAWESLKKYGMMELLIGESCPDTYEKVNLMWEAIRGDYAEKTQSMMECNPVEELAKVPIGEGLRPRIAMQAAKYCERLARGCNNQAQVRDLRQLAVAYSCLAEATTVDERVSYEEYVDSMKEMAEKKSEIMKKSRGGKGFKWSEPIYEVIEMSEEEKSRMMEAISAGVPMRDVIVQAAGGAEGALVEAIGKEIEVRSRVHREEASERGDEWQIPKRTVKISKGRAAVESALAIRDEGGFRKLGESSGGGQTSEIEEEGGVTPEFFGKEESESTLPQRPPERETAASVTGGSGAQTATSAEAGSGAGKTGTVLFEDPKPTKE